VYPDGVAAVERHDGAGDCGGDRCFIENGEPRAYMAYDREGIKALKPKPIGGRQRENMTLFEEKALLVRFGQLAGAGEMLNHQQSQGYLRG
jgi:hypothetical protein